jgi:hypothetical protein
MQPSIEELITYPDELNRTFIFSKISINISFWLVLLLTDMLAAEELMVFWLKMEKLPSLISRSDDFVSTTSLAIRGLMCEVLVS